MERKKFLYILNIAPRVNNFSYAGMLAAQELGVEFHIAGHWSYASLEELLDDEKRYGIKIHQIDFIRTPYHPENIKAFLELNELVKREQFDVIHCNTPIGGMLGRMIGKIHKIPKVIYQAHGFHFYKGAPLLNWLLYYPVEKWLARYTDVLITINREDYQLAKRKMKLRDGGKVFYVPGVGIDTSLFYVGADSRKNKRAELRLNTDDVALISMGDLIERKNYPTAIRAVSEAKNDHLHYFICGTGTEEGALKTLAEQLHVAQQIHFLGFRSDIKELLAASDMFLFTTKQEGLPRSTMEAMASGLPCVASKIRGNVDLIEDGVNGFLCDPQDAAEFAEKINLLAADVGLRKKMGSTNQVAIQKFSTETVIGEMQKIYAGELLARE